MDCKKKHAAMEKNTNVSGLPDKLTEVVEGPLPKVKDASGVEDSQPSVVISEVDLNVQM